MKKFSWTPADNPSYEEHTVTVGDYSGTVYYDDHSDPGNPGWCYKVHGPEGSIQEDICDSLEEGKRIIERVIQNRLPEEDPTYYSIDEDRNERQLTQKEVKAIWENSEAEQRGHAVYDVEEIIVQDQDGERKLWAYRIGDTWTTVPEAFRTMTIHWKE